MTRRSALYVGSVMHRRFGARRHHFRYRAFWLLLDLDEVPELARSTRLFSSNRLNLLSLHDRDHGDGSDTSIRSQITALLRDNGVDAAVARVELFCMPRTLGYVFNPLSVYFCRRPDDTLAAIIYQVHNTFGERHSYVIPVEENGSVLRQQCQKVFYVSPFLDMNLRYDFRLTQPGDHISVAIRASNGPRPAMVAVLSAERRKLSDAALLNALVSMGAVTLKVTAAIHWEALRLWLKRIRLRPRPAAPAPIATVVRNGGLRSS
ncbi:MAG: DUF1365 domain-containing protein [Xanthobacteraceae bacterium]|nr:DUF1365 domain-containing protein [Xanthobacteraceae bacterium]